MKSQVARVKLKTPINPILIFLLSISHSFLVQAQSDESTTTSPLMMFRPSETSAEKKGEGRSSVDVASRSRTASEGPASEALRGDLSPSSLQREETMSIERKLANDIRQHRTIAADIDIANESIKARIAAESHYDEAVSEMALLAQASEQAAIKASKNEDQLKIKRQAHQQGVRNYVWSDRDFSTWELPGELPEIVIPAENCDLVLPPEVLHEAAAALARRFIAEAYDTANVHEKDSALVKATPTVEEPSFDAEEKITNEIIAESLNPSEQNRELIEQRLKARAKANQLLKQAAMLAKESRRLREAQAAANEKPSAFDEKNSMFSNAKSTVFGAFSKANSVTGNEGANEMPMDFETAVQLANRAEQDWKSLALDSERIRPGKEILLTEEQEAILKIWKKADQKLLTLNKKENAVQTLQESWQVNVSRWRLCIEEKKAAQQLKHAEEAFSVAQEDQAIINERDLRGKATNEKKEEASQKLMAAGAELDVARAAASETATAWRAEALQHESVQDCSQEEEQEHALEKLHQSDQAVADVWFKLIDADEAHLQEEFTVAAAQAEIKRERDRCALKQNMDRARYFGEASEVGLILADAKKNYRQGNKAAAKSFYDRANELEIAACQDYIEVVKSDALEAARKRLPELISFWTQRMSKAQAEQEARATAAQFKKPSADSWADETQRALEHATAIAAAEVMGCKIYQKEEQRLNDIETLFIAIIAAKKAALRERPGKATAAYFAGDTTAWENLSVDERTRYNEEIKKENEIYKKPFEEALTIITEEISRIKNKIQKARIYTSAADIEALKTAEAELKKLQGKEEERNKIIGWSQMSVLDRGSEVQKYIRVKKAEQLRLAETKIRQRIKQIPQVIEALEKDISLTPDERRVKLFCARNYKRYRYLNRELDELLTRSQTQLEIYIGGLAPLFLRDVMEEIVKPFSNVSEPYYLQIPVGDFVKARSQNAVLATIEANVFDGIVVRFFGGYFLGGGGDGIALAKSLRKQRYALEQEVTKLWREQQPQNIAATTALMAEEIAWAAQLREEVYIWLQDNRWNKAGLNLAEFNEMIYFLKIGNKEGKESALERETIEIWENMLERKKAQSKATLLSPFS